MSNPPLYEMIKWMVPYNMDQFIQEITFDDFMVQATYFFSQRTKSEGLKPIFDLFDYDHKGYLTKIEFKGTCRNLGIKHVPDDLLDKIVSA